jgi:hypothetical protein
MTPKKVTTARLFHYPMNVQLHQIETVVKGFGKDDCMQSIFGYTIVVDVYVTSFQTVAVCKRFVSYLQITFFDFS